ncbi:MAG: DNA primase [Xanthomonadales bacterium]|nr:DNA primase [Xanthomonadales bacterium]
MAGRIPERFIDDLLARVDVVDVVGERVQLRKAGREWSACCPFHDERTPSFTVSPSKQFYHCFGCGAHGSAIGFLMNYDRMEFTDAVEELARRVGLEVPYEGRRREPGDDLTELYELLAGAAGHFRRQLAASEAAQAYFRQRGLEPATLERFGLGYAPDAWEALKSALGTTPARVALLEKAGLLIRGERGRIYDRFRDRVMFPILDRRGRTIAFGGRILQKSEAAKYLNSPETPLFHKGRELFGLWHVREANPKIARLLVVEGYMDVIRLHQAGLTQAVATLGTATTHDHAEILFRQAPDVYFCFDGDRAGRQAAWRALESVLPRLRDGRQALFLFLPEGEDPDSLVAAEGTAGFERRLAAAMPLSQFFFAELGRDVNLASLDGKARLAERARPLLAQVPDGAFRDLMHGELERLSGVSLHAPATRIATARRATASAPRSLVRAAITLLVHRPQLALAVEAPLVAAGLRQPGVELLQELLGLCQAHPAWNTAMLLQHYAGRDEAGALQKLATSADIFDDHAAAEAEFRDALAGLARQARQQRTDDLLQRQAAGELDEAGKDELRQLLAARA